MSIEIMLMWLLIIDTVTAIVVSIIHALNYKQSITYNKRMIEDNKATNAAIRNKAELESKFIKQQMEKI